MGTVREDIQKREIQLELKVWFWVAVVGLCFTLVNISSVQMEAVKEGALPPGFRPWITEISSLVAALATFPIIARATRTLVFTPDNWLRSIAFHVLGSFVFSAFHISAMVALRKMAWPILLDSNYVFFGDVLREIIYEYRKDLGTYFLVIGALYAVRAMAEQARELETARVDAKKTGRLALKCGARTIHIRGEDFIYGEAAGNYVDVFTNAGQHLVRTSLGALQKQLEAAGVSALRIHRTRLVNAEAIAETMPIGSGDIYLTLNNGTQLRASRRYRDGLVVTGSAILRQNG